MRWARGVDVSQHTERMSPNLRQFGACRVRHADVLEWLWFLNSHRKPIFDWLWGDKDTYRLAFALAGKVENFQLVCIQTPSPYALCLLSYALPIGSHGLPLLMPFACAYECDCAYACPVLQLALHSRHMLVCMLSIRSSDAWLLHMP